MNISEAQHEMRVNFMGGFAGQMVSGLLWLISAALSTWNEHSSGMLALVLGGILIFPLTQLTMRLLGRTGKASQENSLNQLAVQVAFTLPLNLPLVYAATLYREDWFYPAFMIVLGTHYLPFMFLYGMWQFGALAGLLIAGGTLIGMYFPDPFALGAWITGVSLLVFAVIGKQVAERPVKISRSPLWT